VSGPTLAPSGDSPREIGYIRRAVQKKILIVEEEAPIADALLGRLRARGYAPTRVTAPDEALAAFDAERPDLVVASLTLPDDGGRRVCRDIRRRPLGALVPILFVGTGREDVHSVSEAIAAGADHFFVKPHGVGDLVAKVTTYIGPGGEPSAPPSEATAPPPLPMDTPPAAPTTAPAAAAPLAEEPTIAEPPPPGDRYAWALDDEAPAPPAPPALGAVPATAEAPQPTTSPAPPTLDERPGAGFRPPSAPAEDAEGLWESVLRPGRAAPLTERGVGELLAAAARTGLTGRIEVASSGVLRRLFFEGGQPVYADSSADAEDLAAHLAAEGMVARSALERARARVAQVGGSPEELLIEAGYLDPEAVYQALRDHVVQRVLGLFALEAGEAVVVRGGPKPLDPVDLGLHSGRLVLDGVRRKYGRLRLYRAFGTASAVPRPRPGAQPPAGLALRPDEEAVWKACDGHRSAVEIARAARTSEVDALAILYGLSMLDLVEGPTGRRRGALPTLDPERVERAGAPRTADQMPGYADLVGGKLADVRSADYFQVLGVPQGATRAEVRAAWEALKRRFDPHRVRRDSPLWHQVVEIAAVVDDAHTMLSDPRLRARYERALS
jgi:CheY-like chemotaxis protein